MARIMVALKDNKIVTIDDVERGLACGCVCINCGAQLKARKGDEREHHFAHHGSGETMACYEYAFRVATKEALSKSGEITLPINEEKTYVFKYNNVEIIESEKKYGNGLEVLVELKNENDIVLDVLICTRNKSGSCMGAASFRENISRVRVNLINVKALTFAEFRRCLADDISNKEWIYNKKAESIKNKLTVADYENESSGCVLKNQVEDTKLSTRNDPDFYKKLGKKIWEENHKGKR